MISLKLLDGSEQNNGNWTIAWNKCMYLNWLLRSCLTINKGRHVSILTELKIPHRYQVDNHINLVPVSDILSFYLLL